jgi:sulfite exporter TauE/SafE
MIAFGVGAAAPLAFVGYVSRQALARQRDRLIAGAKGAKLALGALLIVLGVTIVSGFDRRLETALVDWSPQWLTNVTTRF